jgi:BirA family biotin operon repressor/biotin-[acetyl-CoA-carboxylase] ligase
MNQKSLDASIQTEHFGRNLLYLQTVNSTNKWLASLADIGAEEGMVTIAASQENGLGRLGRKWFSPEGGLWFSVLLRPSITPAEATKLVFVAGLAVAKALRKELKLDARTKWPNDVIIDGKKVCGILCEMKSKGTQSNYVILGFGINVNIDIGTFPSELKNTAISLKAKVGYEIPLERLFSVVLLQFEECYSEYAVDGPKRIIEEWKTLSCFLGKAITVKNGFNTLIGKAIGVDPAGKLVLELKGGQTRSISYGDVIT